MDYKDEKSAKGNFPTGMSHQMTMDSHSSHLRKKSISKEFSGSTSGNGSFISQIDGKSSSAKNKIDTLRKNKNSAGQFNQINRNNGDSNVSENDANVQCMIYTSSRSNKTTISLGSSRERTFTPANSNPNIAAAASSNNKNLEDEDEDIEVFSAISRTPPDNPSAFSDEFAMSSNANGSQRMSTMSSVTSESEIKSGSKSSSKENRNRMKSFESPESYPEESGRNRQRRSHSSSSSSPPDSRSSGRTDSTALGDQVKKVGEDLRNHSRNSGGGDLEEAINYSLFRKPTGNSNSNGNFTLKSKADSEDGVSKATDKKETSKNQDELKAEKVVRIARGNFHYGSGKKKKTVLNDLEMTVRKGVIYGLLGASGCGKTTTLSCVVGRRALESGRIRVFGGVPGDRRIGIPGRRVGYMPQELALYNEFTIKETLQYFGRIYGMDSEDIDERVDFLIKLLDLPSYSRMVGTLSGGQQRRVSFSVALLHDPELLILDEPTVGVDPMLRQSIWNYLISLVREKKRTVIITTHYIEEARQADMVGLMRGGRLLAEDSPSNLLEIYGMSNLEDVFLKLCVKQSDAGLGGSETFLNAGMKASTVTSTADIGMSFPAAALMSADNALASTLRRKAKGSIGGADVGAGAGSSGAGGGDLIYPGMTAIQEDIGVKPLSYIKKTESEFRKIRRRLSTRSNGPNDSFGPDENLCCHVTTPSFARLKAVMMKNLIKMWRNIGQFLFIFLLPAIQVIFFCAAIGRTPTDLTIAIVNEELGYNQTVNNCTYPSGCDFTNISCRLFDHVFNSTTVKREFYDDTESALEAVRTGKAWGMMKIPTDFSKSLLKRMWSSIDADPETLNSSSIVLSMDTSNQQVTFVLGEVFREGYTGFYTTLLTDCEFPPEVGESPLVFTDPVLGTMESNFTEFLAPGIIILIIFFLAMALTAEVFLTEKIDGLLDRSWIAGVLPSEMLFSHVITQFVVILGQTAMTLVFILCVFQIPCRGPVGWLIGLSVLQGTAGMCYGLLLSTIFNNISTSMQLAVGSFYPCLLLSGILWPVEGMPKYLQKVAWLLPCTAATQAMRDVMSRGWEISAPSVYLGYVSTIAWIGIFLATGLIVIRFKSF